MSACDVCGGTGVVEFEGRSMPCAYCRPDDAREAANVYDPVAVTP